MFVYFLFCFVCCFVCCLVLFTTGVTKAMVCAILSVGWYMVYIKEPLLLIRKSSPGGGSGFPLSLSEWSFTICLTQYYNHN